MSSDDSPNLTAMDINALIVNLQRAQMDAFSALMNEVRVNFEAAVLKPKSLRAATPATTEGTSTSLVDEARATEPPQSLSTTGTSAASAATEPEQGVLPTTSMANTPASSAASAAPSPQERVGTATPIAPSSKETENPIVSGRDAEPTNTPKRNSINFPDIDTITNMFVEIGKLPAWVADYSDFISIENIEWPEQLPNAPSASSGQVPSQPDVPEGSSSASVTTASSPVSVATPSLAETLQHYKTPGILNESSPEIRDLAFRVFKSLFNGKQGKEESVDEYITNSRMTLASLPKGYMPERAQVDIVHGLMNIKFRTHIRRQDVSTIEELRELGMELEKSWRD